MRKKLHNAFAWLLQHVLCGLCKLAFRPKVTYASEKARQEALAEPQIIISNHVRGMDAAVIFSMLHWPQLIALTAKDLQDKSPALKWFMSYMPAIAIDREHFSLAWARESRKYLRNGTHIMIFPEGKCNRAKVVRPFKQGTVMLAAASGARILPIYHNGVYHYFFGKRFRMIIGEPITVTPPPDGLAADVMQQETDQLLSVMNDLERQLTGTVRKEIADEKEDA